MKGRRGGPPRKAWDEGRVWPPDYVRVSEAWRGEVLIPSFLASVLGLLGPGDGQGPHLPKTTFQLQPGKEAPGPRRGEGSRALSRALNAPPITQGLGRLQVIKASQRSDLWQPLGLSLSHIQQRTYRLASRGPACLREPSRGDLAQQTLAWSEVSQQQALPYLVPWGPQQDKAVFPLEEGTKVLALLIAAQLHCLHTLLLILGRETQGTW